jgi:hypothetical protein
MDAYADALGIAAPPPKKMAVGSTPQMIDGANDIQKIVQGLQSTLNDAKPGSDLYARTQNDIKTAQDQLARMGVAPAATPATAAPDPYADALGIGSAPARAPVAAPRIAAAPQTARQIMFGEPLKAPDLSGVPSQLRSVVGNQLTGLGSAVVGGWRGLSTLLTGGTIDDAANNAREYMAEHTYQPDEGTPASVGVASFNSPANPVNLPGVAGEWAGRKVAEVTGSPALGAAVNTGTVALPLLLGLRGKPATAPVDVGPSRPGVGVYRALQLPENATSTALVPQVPQPAAPVGAASVQNGAPSASSASDGTPASVPVPSAPEAVQAVAEKAPAALFPETPTTAPAGSTFPPADQIARAKVLESVGLDNSQRLRRSAITGDGTSGATDFQTSKVDSPAGRHMKAIIDGERAALVNHADTLIQQTGGTQGVDQPALYNRGGTILAPLNKLNDYYDAKARTLYDAANERAQGQPVTLDSFRQVLNDASEMTSPDRLTFRDAAQAFAKKNGMLQADGSIAGNAMQAETFRKWLNKNRTYSNSSFVDGLKESLDNDVLSTAGEDLYTQARALWQDKKATLDNPNGIAKLLQEEGVNRAVPKEMIAPKVVRMPVDQFGHIVQTLKNVPEEIQPSAQGALNEIRAQFANEVHAIGSNQKGQWNAKGVTQYLQNNAARMAQVFTPEEIAAFRNLNDAGHILAKDQSYPGAAIQGHNLITQGVMTGLPSAGAAAGGFVGGPAGAAIGSAAGRAVAGAMENAVTLRAVRKRTVSLSELLGTGVGQ